jgi:hypothetical protein
MGGTGNTSNHKRQIATTGTGHIARTKGPTDICLKNDYSEPTPYENYIDSAKLTYGTTQTFLACQSIWIANSTLAAPSDPEHPPHTMGATTFMPYRLEAWATSWSSDLIAEGQGVVRTDDTTLQNLANTDGYVDGSQVWDAAKAEEELLKQSCTMMSLAGVSVEKKQEAGLNNYSSVSRPLGYPGVPEANTDPYYLEILSGATVTYTAVRHDTTQTPPEVNPGCRLGFGHTAWVAQKAGSWGLSTGEQKTQNGNETFVLDDGFTTLFFEQILGLAGAHKSVSETTGTTTVAGETQTDKESVSSPVDNLLIALMYFYYMANPATIEVSASGCKGVKTSRLRVYPSKKVEAKLDFSSEFAEAKPDKPEDTRSSVEKVQAAYKALKAAIAALSKVKDVVEFADRIAKLAAQPTEFKFMEGASISLSTQYKPCTETKVGYYGRQYTPSHVGMAWTLTLAASPLLGFSFEVKVSLINFIAPGLGETAAGALRLAGVAVDLVFTGGISVELSVAGGADEYQFPTFDGVEVAVKPTFGIAIVVGLGIDIVKVGVTFNGTLALKYMPSEKPTCMMQVEPKGELTTDVYLTVLPDSWFESTWTAQPDFLKLSWLGNKIDLFPVS